MKDLFTMKSSLLLLLIVLLTLTVTDGNPGRRGGKSKSGGGWFGSSSSSSSGGGWFGSKKKQQNNYNNNNYGNNNYGNNNYGNNNYGAKKKSGTMKTLKKAAVIGAVAYGGYQLGKLSSRFSGYGGGYGYGDQRYGFNDWNRWREIDGFMCRDSNDCNWIDRDLYCQDYELDFQPSALWFGGDVARIVGECACPHGMVFDNREMQCERSFMGGIGMIVSSLFAVLILMCCCGCACFMVVRRFF